MYSKDQQLRRAPGSRPLAQRQQPDPWAISAPAEPVPRAKAREQHYQRPEPGRKHYLVRNMKPDTFTKLADIAKRDFDGRKVNWLINHILDAYAAEHS